jgi:hypothetical protein
MQPRLGFNSSYNVEWIHGNHTIYLLFSMRVRTHEQLQLGIC